MLEIEIHNQVKERLKQLLLDDSIEEYSQHESFTDPTTQHTYQILIIKSHPNNIDTYAHQMQALNGQGYLLIAAANEATSTNPAEKTGYKTTALYKP